MKAKHALMLAKNANSSNSQMKEVLSLIEQYARSGLTRLEIHGYTLKEVETVENELISLGYYTKANGHSDDLSLIISWDSV